MGIFNKDKGGGKRKSTTGFSELNRRTYEASSTGRTRANSPVNSARTQNPINNASPAERINASGRAAGERVIASGIPRTATESASNYSRGGVAGKYAQARKSNARKKKMKVALIVIGSILAALIAGAVAWACILSANMGVGDIGLTPTSLDKPFYMVLMGVDSSEERKSDGTTDADYRSDSIILARVDGPEKKVSLISLHRDTEVDMGQHGTQKLNAAHSLGGPELVCKTVSKLAGVNVSHYAEINFDGFRSAVDNLGGIEMNVPIEIEDPNTGVVHAGPQTLPGEEALVICRARHIYDDIGDGDKYRAAMQRMVLMAIAKKALASDILTIAQTVTDLTKYIKTDLSLPDMIGLAQLLKDIDPDTDVYTAMMPTEGVYKDGVWYEKLNEDKWKKMIKRMDEGLPPLEETVVDDTTGALLSSSGKSANSANLSGTVAVRNGTSREGIAASASAKLSEMGFETNVANANSLDYTTTVIVYENDSQRATAEAICDALGCGNVVKNNNEYAFTTDYLVVIGTDYSS